MQNYLWELVQSSFALCQNTAQEIPRAFVVLDQADPIDGIVDFVLEDFRVHSGVLQHKESLIPCGIVAHIFRDQFVNVDQFVVKQTFNE